ncbi:uncharacterized protein LOC121383724 [Gigantopelta aegis]|uniref:uncharacterized protein LOC121383724 n=1 Tax=Gigantopelta aegis TaxID=1735272 RepID=UPI001B8892CC|nr:uncharacterized protein LOC121383724 [Gigantopelta aegis]
MCVCVCISGLNAQQAAECPMIGCSSSGSFSFQSLLSVHADKVAVLWVTQLSSLPLPSTSQLGCVTDGGHVVCPTISGYVSLDPKTGNILWNRPLRQATLPVMNALGDVIGCNGTFLEKIDSEGTVVKPVILLYPPLSPIYSLIATDDNAILIASENGSLVAYETNGVPLASRRLRGTVERINGTFKPIAVPVIAGHRAYVITQFVPDPGQFIPHTKKMQRLYAVDILQVMVNKLRIKWVFNFEAEKHRPKVNQPINNEICHDPVLLYDEGIIYISLTPPTGCSVNSNTYIWALRDEGSSATVVFKKVLAPSDLAKFPQTESTSASKLNGFVQMWSSDNEERKSRFRLKNRKRSNGPLSDRSNTNPIRGMSLLWTVSKQGKEILGLNPTTGYVMSTIHVAAILQVQSVLITSKVMVTRTTSGQDVLIFGVKVSNQSKTQAKNMLVCIQIPQPITPMEPVLLWQVPSPKGGEIIGQIIPVSLLPANKVATLKYEKQIMALVSMEVNTNGEYVFAVSQSVY